VGYELWTSPITGYRRKGTRLAELRTLIDDGITAHAILEPLKSVNVNAPAGEAAEALKRRDFDVAGVKGEAHEPVVNWVLTDSLKGGHVRDHMQPISTDHLVSDATPLPTLLGVLKKKPYTFVLIGPDVSGIITRADLNKPPVRVYLFGLISLLEMHLSFWAQAEYPNDSWQAELSPRRLEAAKKIQEDRRKRNQDPFLVQCLQFCDRRDLAIGKDALRDRLGLGSEEAALNFLKKAEDLRNVLAHSHHDLADGSSWEELIDVVERIESVVKNSDRCVEEKARVLGAQYNDALWTGA